MEKQVVEVQKQTPKTQEKSEAESQTSLAAGM